MVLIVLSIAGAGIASVDMHPAPKIVLSIFSPVAFNNVINLMAEYENLKMPVDDHASGTILFKP